MAASRDFRDKLYDYLELPADSVLSRRRIPRPKKFSPTILLNNRLTTRSFENVPEMVRLLSNHYRIGVSVVPEFVPGTSLRKQGEYFRKVDVYIAAHGAGEVNYMFLPKGASVIEIFPFGMKNMLFERHAKNLGLKLALVLCYVTYTYRIALLSSSFVVKTT